ncbi:MAG: DinB family protein [Marinilabiliaceae bacterium]|nr:DinB family protein [Marinilabiliaceae bacterium]
MAWQVGHLVIATYFHGIGLIAGNESVTLNKLSFHIYRKYCVGLGSRERVLPKGLIDPGQLRNELVMVQTACDEKLLALSGEQLDLAPEPSHLNHPIAATKYEVLSWMFKHDAWHCAEMELIKLNLGLGFKWQ